jgi:hypothetical protein
MPNSCRYEAALSAMLSAIAKKQSMQRPSEILSSSGHVTMTSSPT